MTLDRDGCTAQRHGDQWAYTKYRCRCDDAREAARLYRKRRRYGVIPDARVDATGTKRRLQALQRIGWSSEELARRLGVPMTNRRGLSVLRTARKSCSRPLADKVATLYNELEFVDGPSEHARVVAKSRGYPRPIDWEGVNMDDPTAQPLDDTAPPPDPKRYTGEVDWVVVDRAVSGWELPEVWRREDRIAAVGKLLKRGYGEPSIAQRLGIWERQVARDRGVLRTRAAEKAAEHEQEEEQVRVCA